MSTNIVKDSTPVWKTYAVKLPRAS